MQPPGRMKILINGQLYYTGYGPKGDTGPPGPNLLAASTATNLTGLIKGNGINVSAASAGSDYLAPNGNGSALTGLTESQISGLTTDLAAKAPLASPAFTGNPTAPTQTQGDNSTKLASTAYVDAAAAAVEGSDVDSFNGRTGAVVPVSGDYTAAQTTNTPAGNVAATDVQAAINELDTEKAIDTNTVHISGTETVTGAKTFSAQAIFSALLQANGPFRTSQTAITGTTTLTAGTSNNTQLCDATSGAFSVTLGATANKGYRFYIKKTDASANAVTVLATSIDGVGSVVLANQNDWVVVESTSTSGTWAVIGRGNLTKADVGLSAVTNDAQLKAADLDTDTTLAADSASKVPSQHAVKSYVDTAVTGLLDFKGSTNASGNPNYPAASKGDAYVVTVAGKVGGASGKSVDVGDMYLATADNAGGTEASVGTSWSVLEHNLVGALLSANNLSDVASAPTALANLGGLALAGGTLTDGANIALGTTTGTQIGTATTQKLAFFGATPVVQQGNNTDIFTLLANLGLRGSGGAPTAATTGLIQANGALRTSQATVSASGTTTLTAGTSLNTQLCDATTGNQTLTITNTTNKGYRFTFVKIDASANTVTIQASGSSSINGAATKVLSAQYDKVTVETTGTNGTLYIVG